MNFNELYELITEAAALKSPEQYYTEKFGKYRDILASCSRPNVPQTTIPSLLNDLDFHEKQIFRIHSVLKNNTQMEYFLYWIKAEFLVTADTSIAQEKSEVRSRLDEPVANEIIASLKGITMFFKNELQNHINKGRKRGMKDITQAGKIRNSSENFIRNIQHFLSLRIHAIDTYNFFSNFPTFSELTNKFKAIEEEYYAKFEGNLTQEDLGDKEETVATFEIDGKKFEWVNTHTSQTCDKEAQIMKHCGNSYHAHRKGDEVFSLREILSIDNKIVYKPILTFIVNDSTLRESKGSANDKPSPKYYKHITELLKTGYITKIFQKDSYMAKNNFYFTDLPDDLQQEIKDKFDEENWDFDLEDESMNYDKQIEQSEELIKEANKTLKYVSLELDDNNSEYITYDLWGSFSFPFLNEEFWDKYESYFDDIKGYTEGGSDSMEYHEYTNSQGETKSQINIWFKIDDGFDTETGQGHDENGRTNNDLLSTTKSAIQSAEYMDREIEKELGKALDAILAYLEDEPETNPEINLNLLTNFHLGVGPRFTDIKTNKNNLILIIQTTINDYITYNHLPDPQIEILKTKIKNYFIKYLEHLDPQSSYGTHDLLGHEFIPSDVFEKIKELNVEIEHGSDSYYAARKEKIFTKIFIPNSIYNILSEKLTKNFFSKLHENIKEYINDNLESEVKVKKESFSQFYRKQYLK